MERNKLLLKRRYRIISDSIYTSHQLCWRSKRPLYFLVQLYWTQLSNYTNNNSTSFATGCDSSANSFEKNVSRTEGGKVSKVT